jgi:transmembrane sensor
MTQEEAAELLQKYLAGEATENETARVEAWYGSLPETDGIPADRKKLIRENMRLYIRDTVRGQSAKTSFPFSPWIKAAAILVVLTAVALIFRTVNSSSNAEERTVSSNSHQRKEVRLPDGTTVTLEPSSALIYPARFSSESRDVKLTGGEAFFSVAHENKRPFTVRLKSDIQVKVLGTSFRIYNRPAEDMLKVTVATGKVAVRKGSKILATLIKGQELNFHKKTERSSLSTAVHPNIVRLSFEGSSLEEVIRKMEYVYSIKIQVSDPRFLRLKCRAEFNSGQQPTEILDILCSLHQLKFIQSKDQQSFKIYP